MGYTIIYIYIYKVSISYNPSSGIKLPLIIRTKHLRANQGRLLQLIELREPIHFHRKWSDSFAEIEDENFMSKFSSLFSSHSKNKVIRMT